MIRVRRQLTKRRDAIVESVAARVVKLQRPATDEDIDRIERYDRLIKAAAVKHGSRQHAAFVGLACVTLAGMAWVWPVSANWIQIDARVRGIQLSLPEGWELETPVGLKTVWFENFWIGDMPVRPVQENGGATRMSLEDDGQFLTLRGGDMKLQLLTLSEGAEIDIRSGRMDSSAVVEVLRPRSENAHEERSETDAELLMKATLGAKRGAEGDALTVTHEGKAESFDDAKTRWLDFEFRSRSGHRKFGSMELDLEDKLALPPTNVGLLEFYNEVPENSRGGKKGECSIVEGSLRLLGTQRTLALRDRDCLMIENLESGRLLALTVDHEGRETSDGPIHLVFEGRVRRVSIGPENYLRDVTPSYLEWLYNNQRLALLWGAMVFLWGMLWSVRAMFML